MAADVGDANGGADRAKHAAFQNGAMLKTKHATHDRRIVLGHSSVTDEGPFVLDVDHDRPHGRSVAQVQLHWNRKQEHSEMLQRLTFN